MSETRKFDLLVFDWDGTLVDSEAHIVASIQGAAVALGMRPLRAERIRDVIGLSLPHALQTLYPDYAEPFRERLALAYRKQFFNPQRPLSVFPGVPETIQSLARQGYLLAVATGKGRRGLDQGFAETGLGSYFHTSRTAEETASKPDPLMLSEILEELEVAPGRTLMVGDTEYDMVMAQNAGVAAAAVCYGVHARERLLQYGALTCLEDFLALERWLAGRS
jgi:phosphoglycolate phosphatase